MKSIGNGGIYFSMGKISIALFVLSLLIASGFKTRNIFGREHILLCPAENQALWLKAKPDFSQLKSGDLIFRHGRGFISNALMSLGQREKKYSHAGIITVENGNVFVYHAIGGEQNISNKLRKDRLDVFCSPESVHAFGIYRSDLNKKQIATVIDKADTYFEAGLEFDTEFDLLSDDKMYCTEFIYKLISVIPGNQNYISLSAVGNKHYIACDDLYLNPHFKKIYAYNY